MITKAQLKYVKSLQLKKNRQQQQCFLIEGAKSVLELLASDFEVVMVLHTMGFYQSNKNNLDRISCEKFEVTENQLQEAGTFKTNAHALAVAKIKTNETLHFTENELGLVLDDVRDPGNLGTIIRIADWYGINKIILSDTSADWYNPKVINATMGSFTRVNFYRTNIVTFLSRYKGTVLGAFMDGENIHNKKKAGSGALLVMGNESNGISDEVSKLVTHRVTIPGFGGAESLNVAVATAVLCDNLKRQGL